MFGRRIIDHTIRRGIGGGVAAVMVAAGPWGVSPSVEAEATNNDPIVIHADQQGELTFTDWGYDIKFGKRAEQLTTELATKYFVDYGMKVLRNPVYAKVGHPDRGVVAEEEYAEVVAAVKRAKAVRPDFTVFASLKLQGKDTFPAWVTNDDGTVKWGAYGNLLADFLEYMNSQQINVDVLGPDNERQYNGGDIGPDKHRHIVDVVQNQTEQRGLPMPKIIGPETVGPAGAWPWLDKLAAGGWFDSIDYAGTHYYSRRRSTPNYAGKLARFVESARGKTAWETEFHWDPIDGGDDSYVNAKHALIAGFDHFDLGISGITWWNFNRADLGEMESELQVKLVTSTNNANTVLTQDQDGNPMELEGLITTRSFRQGSDIKLWIINDTDTAFNAKRVEISGGQELGRAPTWIQWSADAGRSSGTGVVVGEDKFTVPLPSKSITLVSLPGVY